MELAKVDNETGEEIKEILTGKIEKLGVNNWDVHLVVDRDDDHEKILVEGVVDMLEGNCEYTIGTEVVINGIYIGTSTGEMDIGKFDRIKMFIAERVRMKGFE